jgi:hypothetical protein
MKQKSTKKHTSWVAFCSKSDPTQNIRKKRVFSRDLSRMIFRVLCGFMQARLNFRFRASEEGYRKDFGISKLNLKEKFSNSTDTKSTD